MLAFSRQLTIMATIIVWKLGIFLCHLLKIENQILNNLLHLEPTEQQIMVELHYVLDSNKSFLSPQVQSSQESFVT
jgi:hypothetical protein